MKHKGFTLIELLVVISIIALILGLAGANLLGARQRARDSVRKSNVRELKNALRLYYNDYQTYPARNASSSLFIQGCGSDHISDCPSSGCTSYEFSAGGADGCDVATGAVLYMKRLPRIGSTVSYDYFQSAGGDDFCLTTALENNADTEIAISQTRCSASCDVGGAQCTGQEYCICAD